MKYFRIFFFIALLFPFSKSYALLITHAISVENVISGSHSFTFDLASNGYNPVTDRIDWVTFSYDVREIVEDPFEDDEDPDTREFVTIYDHFLFFRGIFPDMDTRATSIRLQWTPQKECRLLTYVGDEEICYFKPDQDGFFYSYWNVASDNLWMNSISLTLDVTRSTINEPRSLLLLIGIFPLLILRLRKYRVITAVQ